MNTYKIKVISLLRRLDRRSKFYKQFKDYKFEFVDAIDGQTYKLTKFDKEFIKGNEYKKYDIHIPSLVCANYMHLNLIDECSKGNVPFIIFEDDTEIIKPIDFKFENIVKKDLSATGYKIIDNKWQISEQASDFIFVGNQSINFELPSELAIGNYPSSQLAV